MQFNWKYILPLAVTSLVSLSSVAQADSDSAQLRNLENRVSALEQRKGASGMINPQGRPQVRDGADLFIFGDLLYWHSHENGMNVAIKQHNNNAVSNPSQALNAASTKHIRGKWNWGFRVGMGYNTMHDGWDIKLSWLRFTDNGSKNGTTKDGSSIYPSRTMPSNPINGAGARATGLASYWGYNLNQLDLELGREFFVSKWLTLRPHVGIRSDWMDQSVHVTFDKLDVAATQDSIVNQKDRWWGLGLAGGLNSQWGLGSGWSLFGDATAAIVYGLHSMDMQDINKVIETNAATPFADLHNGYRIGHPILDLAGGIRWDQMFSNDRFHIRLQLGWETHVYFSQNQFPVFTSTNNSGVFVSNQGDLTTQGWTFSTRFDF